MHGFFGGLALAAALSSAHPPPLRAVVRLVAPADDALLRRIRGQTSDLAVELVVERGERLEPDLPAQVRATHDLAAARGARAVVWFRHLDGGGVVVHVAQPDENALLVRWVDAGSAGAALDRSARAEAVALVVRSALRALAAGGRVGVAMPDEPAAPAAPQQFDAPLPPAAALPAAPPPASSPGWHWITSVGWQAVADGDNLWQQGLAAALGAGRGRLSLTLEGSLGIPSTLADDKTSVDLARHAVGVSLRMALYRRPAMAATVGAAAGAIAFARAQAVALSPDVMPSPAQVTTAGFVGPSVDVLWRLWRGRPLWLSARAAADVVLGAPELGYQRGTSFIPRNSLWPVEPRLGLALVLEEP